MSEGIVKFSCELAPPQNIDQKIIDELNRCRTKLLDLGLIGVDFQGIGFGNISVRHGETGDFIISASQTGQHRILKPKYFSVIKKCLFDDYKVQAAGQFMPSAETLTHGAIYASDKRVGAVIHVHNQKLWQSLLENKFLATPAQAQYGSVELAKAIIKMFSETEIFKQKIFAMAGHESGVVAFGENLAEAEEKIFEYYNNMQ